MSDDTFAECRDFFDVLDDRLTFKGFLQVSLALSRGDLAQLIGCVFHQLYQLQVGCSIEISTSSE